MGDLRSFFAAGKAAPIGNTRYPSGYGLTQRRHPAVPPDTTLSPRPFPSGPTALGLQLLLSRPTRPPPPSAPGKSASSGNPATRRTSFAREIRLNWKISRPETSFARKIRRPGTSFTRKSAGQEHRSPGKIHLTRKIRRPDPHSTRHPPCPALSRSALLHRHVLRPFPLAATRAAHRPSRRMACPMSRGGAAPYKSASRTGCPDKKSGNPQGLPLSDNRIRVRLFVAELVVELVVLLELVHHTLLVTQTEAERLEELNGIQVVGLQLQSLLEPGHG